MTKRKKWIGALIGALVGLILSRIVFAPSFDSFAEAIPYVIFSVSFIVTILSVPINFMLMRNKSLHRARSICYVVDVLLGGFLCFIIDRFCDARLFESPWSVLVVIIPYIGFAIIGSMFALVAVPNSIRQWGTSFFALPLMFSFLALLGYDAEAVPLQLKKAKLRIIERHMAKMKRIVEKHQQFLAKRSELEKEVNKTIALDPASLGLVDSQFRRQSQTLDDEQIRKRTIEIDEEIQNTMQSRKNVERKLSALKRRIEALGQKLQEIKHGQHKLESVDPANIGIKLHRLRSEWEGMSRQELEKIKTTSEIERLFQEQLLLGFQIEDENREVQNKRKEIDSMGLTKNTLTLERLILQLEATDRHIKREEPRVLETDGKLKKLEIERDKLRAPLEHGRR